MKTIGVSISTSPDVVDVVAEGVRIPLTMMTSPAAVAAANLTAHGWLDGRVSALAKG